MQDGFEHAEEASVLDEKENGDIDDDSTYHCPTLLWMDYKDVSSSPSISLGRVSCQVDPSLALGFFCKNETEYQHLSKGLKEVSRLI